MATKTRVKVFAHNIEDRILDARVLDSIRAQDADVVLLVEGYFVAEDRDRVNEALASLGDYRYWTIDYASTDGRGDDHGYIVLVKRKFTRAEVTPIQGPHRKFVSVKVAGGEIILVHLDDRRIARRKVEVVWLLEYLGVLGKTRHAPIPQVVMGDFNSTHHNEFIGKLLNSWLVRWFINLLVVLGLEVSPSDTYRQSARNGNAKGWRRIVGKIVSLVRRLRDMTSRDNDTLERLAAHGLVDAVPRGMVTRPLAGNVGVQLDHLVYNGEMATITGANVVLGSPSDHHGVIGWIQWK